jgi:hypothetical protein
VIYLSLLGPTSVAQGRKPQQDSNLRGPAIPLRPSHLDKSSATATPSAPITPLSKTTPSALTPKNTVGTPGGTRVNFSSVPPTAQPASIAPLSFGQVSQLNATPSPWSAPGKSPNNNGAAAPTLFGASTKNAESIFQFSTTTASEKPFAGFGQPSTPATSQNGSNATTGTLSGFASLANASKGSIFGNLKPSSDTPPKGLSSPQPFGAP